MAVSISLVSPGESQCGGWLVTPIVTQVAHSKVKTTSLPVLPCVSIAAKNDLQGTYSAQFYHVP